MKKIGLTLGGGGAKGFAHIPILEVFDELGIKPCCITGTSIGAILNALYASGHSAADIVEMVEELMVPRNASFKEILRNRKSFKVLSMIDPHFSFKPKGLIKGEKFFGFLYEQMKVSTLEELSIPLKTVATDIYVQPPLMDIEMLDFHKAEAIYKQGLAAKDSFKRQLETVLEEKAPKLGWLRRK